MSIFRKEDITLYIQDDDLLSQAQALMNESTPEKAFELAKILEGLDNRNLEDWIFSLVEYAAEADIPEACIALSKFYMDGFGCKRNIGKAFHLAYKAAESGNADAEFFLAQELFMKKAESLRLHYLTRAAHKNHPQAALKAGEIYDYKRVDMNIYAHKRDRYVELADEYYRMASNLGVEDADKKLTRRGRFLRWWNRI